MAFIDIKRPLCALLGSALLFAACASANEDPTPALIGQRIEAFSDASSRGDQPAMDAILDDEVLFSAGDGTVQRDGKRDKDDSLSALLKQQTQAFQDASRRGDRATMRSFLDSEALFVDEDGMIAERGNVLRVQTAIPPKGSAVTITDWVVHYAEDLAVTSFVCDQAVPYGERALTLKSLTVETWIKRDAGWKLMASHSIPLHADPVPAVLPTDALNDYVGSYNAPGGLSVLISRDGSGITSSTNGAKATPYSAEVRDIFFTAGLPSGSLRSRIVFQRNSAGRVIGYMSSRGLALTKDESKTGPIDRPAEPASAQAAVSSTVLPAAELIVHHSGDVAVAAFVHERVTHYYGQVLHAKFRSTETWIRRGTTWKMMTLQSREMEQDPPVAILPTEELDDYAGRYSAGPGFAVSISRHGNALEAADGKNTVQLQAEVRDVFFIPGSPRIRIIFQRNSGGRVAGYLKRQDERDLPFTKG